MGGRPGPLVRAAIVAAAVAALPWSAHADVASARARFDRGDYAGAATELAAVRGKQVDAARLELARVRLRTGAYDEAEKLARAVAGTRGAAVATDARVLLAEILRLRGRLAEARDLVEPLARTQPDRLRARWLLGLLYRDVGDPRAAAVWQAFRDEHDGNKLDLKDGPTLFYLAEAARYAGDFEFANGTYREAIDRAPGLHEANVAWGALFLEKYAPGDAQESFDEVLKLDPHHPDAHAGVAAVKLEGAYDLAAATSHLEQALAVDPRHVPSLLLRAGIEIDQNRWDKARATLGEVFAVAPDQLDAHALSATIHWLRDDTAGYEAEKRKVLGIHRGYGRFFHLIARSAVREHRYREAIELERQAVAIDPSGYEAMEAIGTGYLRLGQEREGLDWLRRAWKGDQYNLRTKNTLELFEDWIPRQYEFATSAHFRLRYHKEEKPIYRRYVEPLLEEAFGQMAKRYGFTPKTPVVIELYQNADHYSVRTIGLPNLGALGVCFGQVITAMSPSVGDINWAMVLWHELSHVFAIQLSNSRVPRWFTEGLSEYETVLARPEWRRENDADVWSAIQDGALPSIVELNYGFMRPDMQEVVVAYHTSSLAVEYLAQTYGFPKIVEALRLYGQGLETPAVLQRVSGRTIAQLDADFRRHLAVRLAPYAGTFHLPTAPGEVARLRRRARAAPRDPDAQALAALAAFYEGEAQPSAELAARALALYPDQPIALYVTAELALRDGETAEAKRRYEQLLRAGHDSFDVRARLGVIEAQAGATERAIGHLCTAKRLDPERAHPYQVLAELYGKLGRRDDQLRELEAYVMIEQMQLTPLRQLIDGEVAAGAWDKVRTFGEMAVEITLADAELFTTLGRAYLETGSPDRALYSYDSALLVRPPMRRPAIAHLGRARALHARGDLRGARRAVDRALAIEPEQAEALALRQQLRGGRR